MVRDDDAAESQLAETYFQSRFACSHPGRSRTNGDNPNEEEVLKRSALFSTSRRQGHSGNSQTTVLGSRLKRQPEDAVKELVNFLPVLAYDGSHMTQVDAGAILDVAMAGTSATLLARKWESAL